MNHWLHVLLALLPLMVHGASLLTPAELGSPDSMFSHPHSPLTTSYDGLAMLVRVDHGFTHEIVGLFRRTLDEAFGSPVGLSTNVTASSIVSCTSVPSLTIWQFYCVDAREDGTDLFSVQMLSEVAVAYPLTTLDSIGDPEGTLSASTIAVEVTDADDHLVHVMRAFCKDAVFTISGTHTRVYEGLADPPETLVLPLTFVDATTISLDLISHSAVAVGYGKAISEGSVDMVSCKEGVDCWSSSDPSDFLVTPVQPAFPHSTSADHYGSALSLVTPNDTSICQDVLDVHGIAEEWRQCLVLGVGAPGYRPPDSQYRTGIVVVFTIAWVHDDVLIGMLPIPTWEDLGPFSDFELAGENNGASVALTETLLMISGAPDGGVSEAGRAMLAHVKPSAEDVGTIWPIWEDSPTPYLKRHYLSFVSEIVPVLRSEDEAISIRSFGWSTTLIDVRDAVSRLHTESGSLPVVHALLSAPDTFVTYSPGRTARIGAVFHFQVCATGHFIHGDDLVTLCDLCTPGYQCPGNNLRLLCGPGEYSDAGASRCLSCGPTGYTSPQHTECAYCPANMVLDANRTVCTECPAHYLCNGTNILVVDPEDPPNRTSRVELLVRGLLLLVILALCGSLGWFCFVVCCSSASGTRLAARHQNCAACQPVIELGGPATSMSNSSRSRRRGSIESAGSYSTPGRGPASRFSGSAISSDLYPYNDADTPLGIVPEGAW